MKENWIVLMILIPMATGVLSAALKGFVTAQRIVGLISLLGLVCTAFVLNGMLGGGDGILFSYMGEWAPPYGIAIVYDGLSGTMLTVASFVSLCAYLCCWSMLPRDMERSWFHPLFHLLVLGVNFSFLTGDLFNLFVAFEIMLLASYALLCLGGRREQIVHAHKYVILNLVGSTVFVLVAGLIYGMVGTLNYADLARIAQEALAGTRELPAGFSALSIALLFVFALKAAVFPLWFWLPDTYHTLPAPLTGLFAALLSKVGIYAVLRLYPSTFATPGIGELGFSQLALSFAAGLTMVVAILSAFSAVDLRRVLSMLLIAHVGYLIFGISLMTPEAHAGTLHYMAQEMLLLAGLFVAAGLVIERSGTADIREMGGMMKVMPKTSGVFFLLSMGMIGIPPLSGFYGKALMIREGADQGAWWLVGATVFAAVMTTGALLRVWTRVFWSPTRGPGVDLPEGAAFGPYPSRPSVSFGLGALALASVVFSLAAEPTLVWTKNATRELTAPNDYIATILGTPGGDGLEGHDSHGHSGGATAGLDGPAVPMVQVPTLEQKESGS